MKKQPIQSATSLPPSPDQERHSRMIKYTVAMAIRMICFVVALFIHNWWSLIPIAGTIILPYVAVVLANTVVQPKVVAVERPGGLVSVSSTHHSEDA